MKIYAAFNEQNNIVEAFYHSSVHSLDEIPSPKILISDSDHVKALNHMSLTGKVKANIENNSIELIPIDFDFFKDSKLNELKNECEKSIEDGFFVKIEKNSFKYPSKVKDQININFSCTDLWRENNSKWEYVQHTSKQLQIVKDALSEHIKLNRYKLSLLVNKIDNCKNEKELAKVIWNE